MRFANGSRLVFGVFFSAILCWSVPIIDTDGQTLAGIGMGGFGTTGTIYEYSLLTGSGQGEFQYTSTLEIISNANENDGLLLSYNFIATADMTNASTHVFLDAEIDEGSNTWFNEMGESIGIASLNQSWEIDEPGYIFGDIYDNFFNGTLDNSVFNGDNGLIEDVSMSLGFNFGNLSANDNILLEVLVSESLIEGNDWGIVLHQWDADLGNSGDELYLAGRYTITNPVSAVPEPTSLAFLTLGMLGLASRKILKKEIRSK